MAARRWQQCWGLLLWRRVSVFCPAQHLQTCDGPAHVRVLAVFRAGDCERATATNFQSKECLCDASQPYLYCNAQLAKEAAATVETKLRNNVLNFNPCERRWTCF